MRKLGFGLAVAIVATGLSTVIATPAFATGTVSSLTVDKTSVASNETFTISATGTDWNGCFARVSPGHDVDQFAYDVSGDISYNFGEKSWWNGYGSASGLSDGYSVRLYSAACASVTQGTTTPDFEVTVHVAPVHGAGSVNVTLYETYDSATLASTPYDYPTMSGSFDGASSGWSELDPSVWDQYCGAGITGLPAGVSVDQTYSPGGGVPAALKFTGTPAAGAKGTYTTCLDLYDGDSICEDSYWIATIEVSDGVPTLPSTGLDEESVDTVGISAAGIVALGAVFVVAYRRRSVSIVKHRA